MRDHSNLNDGYTYRETIAGSASGRPLDRYLAETYAHSTLALWQERIAEGRVLLDGRRGEPDELLRFGQVLEWHRLPWEEPDAPLHFALLHEDAQVLVIDKPAGLPTMPGGGFLQHTLVHQLRLIHPDASPMHRLGRWTSGAVLCARGPAAGAHIAAQFAARSITKHYRALASGCPELDRFEVTVPIGPVPYAPLGTLHAASPAGRPALSSVEVIDRRDQAFLCDVRIATGRPHQIRVHLAAAGHPLVGDPLYRAGGLPDPAGTALPGDPGYHLHAAELGFEHPDGSRVVVRAHVPEALRKP